MRVFSLSFTILAASLLAGPAMAEPPKVAASIPPVHSVVAMVTGEVTSPALLIPGDASPHDHALRPSEARALSEAEIVVWMGEGLESPLAGPIATLGQNAQVLTLLDLSGESLLPLSGDQDDEHGHGHDHGDVDPHAWLDPLIATAWLGPIAEALAAHDPENAATYRANAAAAAEALAALTERIGARLAPVRDRDYVVLHDAYRYFERRFGLARADAVKEADAASPGARHISGVLATLSSLDRPCLFAEPQEDRALAERLAGEGGARLGRLDPVGQELDPGPGLYPALIENMADAFLACLHD